MKKSRKSTESKIDFRELLKGPRKAFVIVPACVLVIGLSWFAYKQFTVMPPPNVKEVKPKEVVEFLSSPRGWIQMPVEQRQEYAVGLWDYYRQAPQDVRAQLNREFQTMSLDQKEMMGRAALGIGKSELLKKAGQYGQISNPAQRQQFVQKTIKDMKEAQAALAGGGPEGTGVDVAKGFRDALPKDSGDVQKIMITESTPGERAKAEPLVNAMVQEHEQQIRSAQGR